MFFFHFLEEKKLKYYFKIEWLFFCGLFEVLNISVRQKIKILKNHPDFLIFSANALDHFKNCQILSYRKAKHFKAILRIEARIKNHVLHQALRSLKTKVPGPPVHDRHFKTSVQLGLKLAFDITCNKQLWWLYLRLGSGREYDWNSWALPIHPNP